MTKEEILSIIIKHGVSFSEIARDLCITVQSLHYQLNLAKKFDTVLEQQILQSLRKRGITENNQDEGKMISDQLLEHASLTNHQISVLTQTVKQMLDDNKITQDEREIALMRIRNFRKEVNDSLDELESLIAGEIKSIRLYR